MDCERCEVIPELIEGEQNLYLWPPLGHTTSKIKMLANAFDRVREYKNTLVVAPGPEGFKAVLEKVSQQLTPNELQDTMCLLHPVDKEPGFEDFSRTSNLRRLASIYQSEWLLSVLQEKQLGTAFHPIVPSKSTGTPYAHECLLRWDDGNSIKGPGQLFSAAKEADLLFILDRTARETHLRNAAAHSATGKLFINFTPTSIYDPRNCLRSTFRIAEEVGLKPEQIVFEVVETEKVDDSDHLKNVLEYYKQHGFQVALDDLGSGYATIQLLGALKPDYVKIDMDLIRNVDIDPFKAAVLRRLIDLAHDFGILVIAEGIETQGEANWLTEHNADFLQGFYFAKPESAPVLSL